MRFLLFWIILLGACAYALYRGDRDHRTVALLCLTAAFLSHFLARPYLQRFTGLEPGIMAIDILTLGGFTVVALASSRFWPLWIAGLQLTTNLAHLAKGLDLRLLPTAYGAAAAFWSYPILVILVAATWRAHRRNEAERGDGNALA